MEAEERPAKLRKIIHETDGKEDPLAGAHNVFEIDEGLRNPLISPDLETGNSETADDNVDTVHIIANGVDSSNGPVNDQQLLSKSQMKKLRKREEWEAGRDFRKARRKQKATEKKARKRLKREDEQQRLKSGATEAGDEHGTKHEFRRRIKLPIAFIIDCGFDDLMLEKERISLGSQLTRCYSDNHQAIFQAHLLISSWNGLLKERFDTVLNQQHRNWRGVRFQSDDFAHVAEEVMNLSTGKLRGQLAGAFEKYAQSRTVSVKSDASELMADTCGGPAQDLENGTDFAKDTELTHVNKTIATTQPQPASEHVANISNGTALDQPDLISDREIIYLTSDSPNTLDELKPYSTYIIGGLVDKNRHKGICYKTACDHGIKTAKLPIGEYMEMQSRFVLATNHVLEIMLNWLECGNWGEAFMRVIPKRKGGKLKSDHLSKTLNGRQSPEEHEEDVSEVEAQEASGPEDREPSYDNGICSVDAT